MLLAIQPGAIGDFVLSLPALRALRQTLGANGMEIWAERASLPLVDHPAYADRVRPLAETGLDSYPLPQRTLEAMKPFGAVVSWRGANLPELIAAVSAVHPRALFFQQFPPQGSGIHLADFRRQQLAGTGVLARPGEARDCGLADMLLAPPQIFFFDSDRRFADEFLHGAGEPVVVLHPGASSKRKQWEAGRFAAVALQAQRQWNARVLFTEGPRDAEAIEAVLARAPQLRARRIRIPNLRHLAAVLSRAQLFIGNDTGIAHLAAAAGAPTAVIFRGTDPRTWAPRGPSVRVLIDPEVVQVSLAMSELLRRHLGL